MKYPISLTAAVFVSLLCLSHTPSQAQAPSGEDGPTIVRVNGLNASTRDAVVSELSRTSGMRLVYACVPAGILVFESDDRNVRQARMRSVSAVEKHARAKDITVLPISRKEAEEQCAQARNR